MDADSAQHYIGETTEVRRRFQRYRKPGPSQATNIRVNALLKEHLESGGSAEVDIIVDGVTLTVSGEEFDADLSDKATHRVPANAALVAESGTDIDTLNRQPRVTSVLGKSLLRSCGTRSRQLRVRSPAVPHGAHSCLP